jgi:hypothetical protein
VIWRLPLVHWNLVTSDTVAGFQWPNSYLWSESSETGRNLASTVGIWLYWTKFRPICQNPANQWQNLVTNDFFVVGDFYVRTKRLIFFSRKSFFSKKMISLKIFYDGKHLRRNNWSIIWKILFNKLLYHFHNCTTII